MHAPEQPRPLADGNRVRITHPDVAYFRSDFDTLSRPDSIWENGATNMSGFTYYAHGAVSGLSRANGSASGFGYDSVQRLSGMVQYLAGTANNATWSYSRNPAGGIASVAPLHPPRSLYAYHLRLSRVSHDDAAEIRALARARARARSRL